MQLLLQTPSLLFCQALPCCWALLLRLGLRLSWAPLVLGSSESSRLKIGRSCNYMISCQVKQMVAVLSVSSSLCDATPGHWIGQPFQSQLIYPSWETTFQLPNQCCPHAIYCFGMKNTPQKMQKLWRKHQKMQVWAKEACCSTQGYSNSVM